MGRRLWATPINPLLVSVRSGAAFSMPGMMETVLNIGLNDDSVLGPGRNRPASGSPGTPTADCCRCSASTVLGIDSDLFEEAPRRRSSTPAGTTEDTDLDRRRRWPRTVWHRYKTAIFNATRGIATSRRTPASSSTLAVRGRLPIPGTPTARVLYRRQERIPEGPRHGRQCPGDGLRQHRPTTRAPGVCFTRDPASTGDQGVYGDYLHERPGRGRRRRHPQRPCRWHDLEGRVDPKAYRHSLDRDHGAPSRSALPRPVRHRVHHRARHPVDVADAGRQADRPRPPSGSPASTWPTRASSISTKKRSPG
jgi:hypothetical protein